MTDRLTSKLNRLSLEAATSPEADREFVEELERAWNAGELQTKAEGQRHTKAALAARPERPRLSYHQHIKGMEGGEALNYCLGLLNALSSSVGHEPQVPLSKSQQQIFDLLYLKEGKPMHKDALYEALYGNRAADDLPYPKILDVQICNLRARLKPTPWRVLTRHGFGWQLEKVTGDARPH